MHNSMNETTDKKPKGIGTYLSFLLGNQVFAINVAQVEEIIKMRPITRIPGTSSVIEGIVNLRGKALPVTDIRERLTIKGEKTNNDHYILVVTLTIKKEKVRTGILVENVEEVFEITTNKIKPIPSLGSLFDPNFLEGSVQTEGHSFIMILNVNTLFSADDINLLHDAEQKALLEKTKSEKNLQVA